MNPLTHKRVLQADNVPYILAEMMMEGLYGRSGDWAYRVGLPGKSGVGGGILAVVPGVMGIAAFSPPLDEEGNSVRGQKWWHRSLSNSAITCLRADHAMNTEGNNGNKPLGLWNVVSIGIGAMVGAGIFALLGQAALLMEASTWVAFALAVLWRCFPVMPMRVWGRAIPAMAVLSTSFVAD